jgi:2-polyprenyl-6-methoxyphenol hydroxylase-like FAD-dependent oxidoreductase
MFHRKKPEVLVVGAGPVGLFTALMLARRDVPVEIIDQEWGTGAHSYALALHAETHRLLEDVGLLSTVLNHAYRVRTIGFYEGANRRAEVHLSDLGEDFSFLTIMRQNVLEDVLVEALNTYHVQVKWNHQLARLERYDDHVVATIDKVDKDSVGYAVAHTEWQVVRTKDLDLSFVVGADGHLSDVRSGLELDFKEVAKPTYFAVFEFKTNVDLEHEMRIVMDDETTNVLWPLPDGYCRWSFQLPDFEAPDRKREKDRFAVQMGGYPMLNETVLHHLIETRAPWFKGSVDQVEWRMIVRFEQRLVSDFGKGRVWLVGDAGHVTGPVGIQSMNVGLREACDLADTLANIIQYKTPLDALGAYNRDRLAEWRFLLGLEGGLRPGPTTSTWVKQRIHRLLPCFPASGDDLIQLAHQLGLETGALLSPKAAVP